MGIYALSAVLKIVHTSVDFSVLYMFSISEMSKLLRMPVGGTV